MHSNNVKYNFIDNELKHCVVCPRKCGIDRTNGQLGYCKIGSEFSISNICIHKGEEPVLSGKNGICNVFFTHCNLQCIYCQNYQISKNNTYNKLQKFDEIINKIIDILKQNINIVGFVSPSHVAPQVKEIITELRKKGYNPKFVWNSNGYDNVETLKGLESFIDVYLPDIKYVNNDLSFEYSDAKNYFEIAFKAVKEMFYQKGKKIYLGNDNIIERGVIIRHLVLPEKYNESKEFLKVIANEFGTGVTISLMSQYFPTINVANHKILSKKLKCSEYNKVVDEMYNLGFFNGWVQNCESSKSYIPDFEQTNPFEN